MQFGLSAPRSPCSERARPLITVIGRPVRAWKMRLSLQPPRTASVAPDQSEPHLCPLPNGSS